MVLPKQPETLSASEPGLGKLRSGAPQTPRVKAVIVRPPTDLLFQGSVQRATLSGGTGVLRHREPAPSVLRHQEGRRLRQRAPLLAVDQQGEQLR